MKTFKYIYSIVGMALLALCMQSCFQDLGQDIPFDYPEQPEVNIYEGQFAYFSFDENYNDKVGGINATVVGTPALDAGKEGKAYKGAANSYITIPATSFGAEFTATFWYKLNTTPDRAGIICCGPDDPAAGPNDKNNRTSGFRLFREGGADSQVIKLNVGNGTEDSWLDGGDKATLKSGAAWAFIAFTMNATEAKLYINGKEVSKASVTVSWKNCPVMTIGSGAPYFTGWSHLYEGSLIDELRLYNKALSELEINTIMSPEDYL